MKKLLLVLLMTTGTVGWGQQQPIVPTSDQQIATAILPLPKNMRAETGVRGYDRDLKPIMLRLSKNGMVCVGQKPGKTTFDVRCYHESFLPVVDRMRELFGQRRKPDEVFQTMESEIKTGTLKLPQQPTAGYRMEGPITAYDPKTNVAGREIQSWQSVHFPYRTAAEIGLQDESDHTGSMPFVMTAGTFWSHVMIVHEEEPEKQDTQSSIKRTDVLNTEMAGMEGKEAHMWIAEIGPGASTGKHSHPTPRFVYVIAGSVTLELEGKPEQTFKAGEGYEEMPGVVHNFRNSSATEPAKALGFQITAKGQPLQY